MIQDETFIGTLQEPDSSKCTYWSVKLQSPLSLSNNSQITNDDGPPNDHTSPYVHYFVEALREHTDWDLSIALPNKQQSWIGKAHMIGQSLTASYIYPGKTGEQYDGPYYQRVADSAHEEWTLLDGTPASCANVGIHHLFQEKGPIDLVLSGPNFGRNSTALYIMSSGTIGAAMEGALCGVKSVGLSFAYEDRSQAPPYIKEACKISAKLIKHLYENWDEGAQLYSINVPLTDKLAEGAYRILYTHILENTWGANFEPWEDYEKRHSTSSNEFRDIAEEVTAVATVGAQPSKSNVVSEDGEKPKNTLPTYELNSQGLKRNKNLTQFKWNPDFDAVHESVRVSSDGNDGLVVDQGNISVTPLRAVFKDVLIHKEIKLS